MGKQYLQLPHLDAEESIFFQRELEVVKAKTYDVQYPQMLARSLFPISRDASPGAEFITYYQYDMTALAKVISNYADDLPRANVKGKAFTSPIRTIADSYGYNYKEINAAKFAGKPLEQKLANAAKMGMLQKENRLAFFGEAASGIPGFLSNANIGTFTLPADGTGASKTFASKTADQIIRDMNSVVNKVFVDTKGVWSADTLVLPLAQYALIASTPRSTTSDTTILSFFKASNPFIKEVIPANEMFQAGTASADVMVAYAKNPDVLTMEVAEDFRQHEVEKRGLEYVVACTEEYGGILIYQPLVSWH